MYFNKKCDLYELYNSITVYGEQNEKEKSWFGQCYENCVDPVSYTHLDVYKRQK